MSEESRIIYTLAPGVKQCKRLVKRDLQSLNDQFFIIFISIYNANNMYKFISTSKKCAGNKSSHFLKQNTYLWPSHNLPYHVVFKGEV